MLNFNGEFYRMSSDRGPQKSTDRFILLAWSTIRSSACLPAYQYSQYLQVTYNTIYKIMVNRKMLLAAHTLNIFTVTQIFHYKLKIFRFFFCLASRYFLNLNKADFECKKMKQDNSGPRYINYCRLKVNANAC